MKEEKIKVLALLPMELPKEIELDNTLEAMQKFVGGLIECITLSDTGSAVTLVCNDEGKLLGLPLNRPLWDGADVLAGPGFLAGCDNEGNLTSLPQSAMDFYKEKCRTLFTHFPSACTMDAAIMKLHDGNVFPSARIASICGSNSLILVYFLDITKPPRVVLLSYTGRSFVYCLLFTDRFSLLAK